MEQEIREQVISKKGHSWRLVSRLRRDFAVEKEEDWGMHIVSLLFGLVFRRFS